MSRNSTSAKAERNPTPPPVRPSVPTPKGGTDGPETVGPSSFRTVHETPEGIGGVPPASPFLRCPDFKPDLRGTCRHLVESFYCQLPSHLLCRPAIESPHAVRIGPVCTENVEPRAALVRRLQVPDLASVAELEISIYPAVAEMRSAGFLVDEGAWSDLVSAYQQEAYELHGSLVWDLGVDPDDRSALLPALSAGVGAHLPDLKKSTLAPYLQFPTVRNLLSYRSTLHFAQDLGPKVLAAVQASTDGRVRGHFDQLGCATGRFTCHNPNLLGIPRDTAVRNCFVAPDGMVLVVADYRAIELRVLAQVTQDAELIALFRRGDDPHTLTASRMLGKDVAQITDYERGSAKAVNFGVTFGQGADGFRLTALEQYGIRMTIDQAETYRNVFLDEYREVRRWQERMASTMPCEVRTLAGRVRRFEPNDGEYCARLATEVQGSAADGIKMAIALLHPELARYGARIVLVVHDELIVEAPSEVARLVNDLVVAKMQAGMGTYITSVPIEVDARISPSWAEGT